MQPVGNVHSNVLNSSTPKKTNVKYYEFDVAERVKDFAPLKFDELRVILEDVNQTYTQIEANNPAEGYYVRFEVYAKNKRTVEVILEAHGKREKGSQMVMPANPKSAEDCGFCKYKEPMEGYAEATTKTAHVVKSQEGNPITISRTHHRHLFEMSVDEQTDFISTGLKMIEIAAKTSSRFNLRVHVGVKGHQTMGHAHVHGYKGLGN